MIWQSVIGFFLLHSEYINIRERRQTFRMVSPIVVVRTAIVPFSVFGKISTTSSLFINNVIVVVVKRTGFNIIFHYMIHRINNITKMKHIN